MQEDCKHVRANAEEDHSIKKNIIPYIGYELIIRVCNDIIHETSQTHIKARQVNRHLLNTFIVCPFYNFALVRGFVEGALRRYGKTDLTCIYQKCIVQYNLDTTSREDKKIISEILRIIYREYKQITGKK